MRGIHEGGTVSRDAVAGITVWVSVVGASARLHAPIADHG
jgi:hypothetical protein